MGFLDNFLGVGNFALGALDSIINPIMQRKNNRTQLKIARETNKNNYEIAQMNNEYNQEMLEQQLQNQWDMWNAENDYNDAASQRQRLEDAGLNPYLMLDGGDAGSASSMTAPTPAPASPVTMQPAQVQPIQTNLSENIGQAIERYYANKVRANQVESTQLQNEKQSLENDILRTTLAERKQMVGVQLDNMLSDYYLKQSQKTGSDLDNTWKRSRNVWDPFRWSSEIRHMNERTNIAKTEVIANTLSNLTAIEWYKVLPTTIRNELTEKLVDIQNKRLAGKLTEAQTQESINRSVTEFYNAAFKDAQAQGQLQTNEFEKQKFRPTLGKMRSDCFKAMFNRYGELDNPLSYPGFLVKGLNHQADQFNENWNYFQGY